MIIVDSSGWIEYFAGRPLADQFERHIVELDEVLTPTIILYEVYKKFLKERTEEDALVVAAQIAKTNIVPLSPEYAILAAEISAAHSLSMADAIIYSTALRERCKVVTSDPHFQKLDSVIFIN